MTLLQRPLVVDAQVFQTVAWDRGMGKYSLHFLRALIPKGDAEKDVTLIFSRKLVLKDEVANILRDILPCVKFVFLDLDTPTGIPGESLIPVQTTNIGVLDAFIEQTYDTPKEVDFLIASLFIGEACPVFPSNVRAFLIFYDLIPFQYPRLYGNLWSYQDYLERFSVLFRADKYFAISATVAEDLRYFIGISSKKIQVVDGARIPRDSREETRPDNVTDRFVLMTSGNDLRKNNQRAIEAFEHYRKDSGDESCRLVITSFFDDDTKKRLTALSSAVHFAGNVSEGELLWLYRHAEAVLFVPEYEGLGLPILEGVEEGCPIVCSDIGLFREEMSSKAFYMANPYNVEAIAEQIGRALRKEDFEDKFAEYQVIKNKYSWKNTGQIARESLANEYIDQKNDKKKIAILTPDPSGYSAIGKVTMLAHSSLSQYADVDYFIEGARSASYNTDRFTRPSFLKYIAETYDISQFNARQYAQYDAVFYMIGNSEFHIETYKNASYLPGYVVFHDIILDGLLENELHRFGHIGTARLELEDQLDERLAAQNTRYATSILAYQTGAIAYSDYAEHALGTVNIIKTPIRRHTLPTSVRTLVKSTNTSRLRIGFAGIINTSKGLSSVGLIAALDAADHQVAVSVFGIALTDTELVDELKTYDNIEVETNVTDFEFSQKLSQLDMLICYRSEYHGEASLTVVEAMAHGVVPVVRRIGWYDELPDNVAIKVDAEEELSGVIEGILSHPDVLLKYKNACVEYAAKYHSYERYARNMIDSINKSGKDDGNQTAFHLKQAFLGNEPKERIRRLIE